MDRRTQWSVLVDRDGTLFEWEDSIGYAFLANLPHIADYACHFLHTTHRLLSFYFQSDECDSGWLYIELSHHKQYALVRAVQVELPFSLSEREFQILSLVAHGLSNNEIAECLFISDRTVAKHIEHIFVKTKVENRTLLAIFAHQHNLICLPTPPSLKQSPLPIFEVEHFDFTSKVQTSQFNYTRTQLSPITIGVPFVESGLGEIDSKELLNGTMLAVDLINQRGGIQGRQLQIASVGYQVEDKHSILHAYQQLFEQEVDAISTNYACYLPEVHELVAMQNMPYLHDASHSGSDKSGKIGNIFQVCASSVNYGLGVVRFLQQYQHHYPQLLKNRRVVLLTVKWQLIDIGLETFIASLGLVDLSSTNFNQK